MRMRPFWKDQRGVTAMTTAMTMMTLMGMAAFAIDLGHAFVTRQELQNVADSGALAGARQMAQVLQTKTTAELQDASFMLTSGEIGQITAAANNVAVQNHAGGQAIALDTAADVTVGVWNQASNTLTAAVAGTVPSAVQVVARRDASTNGQLSTFFAQTMGFSGFDLSATATAALLSVGFAPPGGIGLPVGVSDEMFNSGACGDSIKFYPTGVEGCGGWHTFEWNANANNLKDILNDLEDCSGGILPNCESPAVHVGDELEFNGGTIDSSLKEMQDLFDAKKSNGVWETFIIVYDGDPSCPNPTGLKTVVGFAKITITNVKAQGNPKDISGVIECQIVDEGRAGAGNGSGIVTGSPSGLPVLVS